MAEKIVRFTVDLTINDGKFNDFESIAKEMIVGSRKEPGTLGYDFFLSTDRKRCRLLETYADASAVVAHMTGAVVQQLVPKALTTVSITGFEVYGDPGPVAAKMLAGFGGDIFEPWHQLGR
jgi:quinol monooxygenase YgiN